MWVLMLYWIVDCEKCCGWRNPTLTFNKLNTENSILSDEKKTWHWHSAVNETQTMAPRSIWTIKLDVKIIRYQNIKTNGIYFNLI